MTSLSMMRGRSCQILLMPGMYTKPTATEGVTT